MVRAALVEAGVEPQFARAIPDHPYRPTVFAEPWRVTVPSSQLRQGQDALARLEHDVADETERQARAWYGREEAADSETPTSSGPPRQHPRLGWALALAVALPFPTVCFYVRAHRMGALFLGIFVAAFAFVVVDDGRSPTRWGLGRAPLHAEVDVAPPPALQNDVPSLSLTDRIVTAHIIAKLGDAIVGIALLQRRRRKTSGVQTLATSQS